MTSALPPDESAPPGPVLVLVHGPLTGLLTWSLVASALWEAGIDVIVPGLHDDPSDPRPCWEQHVEAVAASVGQLSEEEAVVLVGHSGAGVLLPAIGAAVAQPVAGYVFVDADLPRDGASRLDAFPSEEARAAFRARAVDGMIPPFDEALLRPLIPDPRVRAEFRAELRSVPLTVYEEPIPVPPAWPDAPCAYLAFRGSAPIYAAAIEEARRDGWPLARLDGAHFHLLVDPEAVAEALLDLVDALLDGDEAAPDPAQ